MSPETFIERASWRFAKTMPDTPHEYTVRGETPDEDFDWFVTYIRKHGYRDVYAGRAYIYLNVGDWRYWTMGAPLLQTVVINRALLSSLPTLDS